MTDSGEHGFLYHLEALRTLLLRSLTAIAIAMPFCLWAMPWTIQKLIQWCCPPELGPLNYFSPMEVFIVELKLSFVAAIALTYPYIATQIWNFLVPALYPKERRAIKLWVISATLLFVAGAAFCIGLILPLLMKFSAGFASTELHPMLGLSNFVSMAGWLILGFGLMFQFPILVMLLVKFDLVSVETFRSKRPYVIVVILVLAAVLTPPDVVSQLLLAIPTWLLFEGGLFIAARTVAPEKKEEEPSEPTESQPQNHASHTPQTGSSQVESATPPPPSEPVTTEEDTMSDFYTQQEDQ